MSDITLLVQIISFVLITSTFVYMARKEIAQILFGYGVPFVKTADKKVDAFIRHLRLRPWQKFLDLGSGDGKILHAVEDAYVRDHWSVDGLYLYGIERSPFPYQESVERKKKYGLHYTVQKKDFFSESLTEYDIIYIYMITYLMSKIWRKIESECKSGTLVYTNGFAIPWVEPIEVIPASEKNSIFVYRVQG